MRKKIFMKKNMDYLKRLQKDAEYCGRKLGGCSRNGRIQNISEIHGEIMNLIDRDI